MVKVLSSITLGVVCIIVGVVYTQISLNKCFPPTKVLYETLHKNFIFFIRLISFMMYCTLFTGSFLTKIFGSSCELSTCSKILQYAIKFYFLQAQRNGYDVPEFEM